MDDKFLLCVATGQKGADDRHLLFDRICRGDRKDKGHNHDDHVKQHSHHALIRSHIRTGKVDRPIQIAGCEGIQDDLRRKILGQRIRHLFFFARIFRRFIVFVGVVVGHILKGIKTFIADKSDRKVDRIKHHVIIAGKHRRIIRQGNLAN